ncbi:MAG: hypothetical protein ABH869_04160, partial [Candidatus Omnitrophota bacterium]
MFPSDTLIRFFYSPFTNDHSPLLIGNRTPAEQARLEALSNERNKRTGGTEPGTGSSHEPEKNVTGPSSPGSSGGPGNKDNSPEQRQKALDILKKLKWLDQLETAYNDIKEDGKV